MEVVFNMMYIYRMRDSFIDSTFLPWIDSFLNFEKLPVKNIFWLDMMESLCSLFNNPENAIPCIHVAGSKGKGSVSRMAACMLKAAGKKTGIYSSPHISDFRERISTTDGFFEESVYEAAGKKLMERLGKDTRGLLPEGRQITWFELVTVFAFLCMKEAGCDFAVYEVGLGGRLDATNVITPLVSVLNTIELEHTEFLGDTLEKIAGEKAGIIKKSVPAVSAPQEECVRSVFKEKAAGLETSVAFSDSLVKKSSCHYSTENGKTFMVVDIESELFKRPLHAKMKLLGKCQLQNAILAAVAVKTAVPEITETQMEKGLEEAELEARFQIWQDNAKYPGIPSIIIDGAHTVKSAAGTMETFRSIYGTDGRKNECHLIFACAADKDVKDMAKMFAGNFSKVTLTRPGSTKACNPVSLCNAFREAGMDFTFNEDYENAIKDALAEADRVKAQVMICGSFYLASEALKVLEG